MLFFASSPDAIFQLPTIYVCLDIPKAPRGPHFQNQTHFFLWLMFPTAVNGFIIHPVTQAGNLDIIDTFLSFIISNQMPNLPWKLSWIKTLILLLEISDLAQALIIFYLATCDSFVDSLFTFLTHCNILKCICIK